MRRRRRKPVHSMPVDLATFRVESWRALVEGDAPDGYRGSAELWRDLEAVRLWKQARQAWLSEHPSHGLDPLAVIREHREAKLAVIRNHAQRPE